MAPRRGAGDPALDATVAVGLAGRLDLGQDRLAGRRGRDVVRRGVGPPLDLDRPFLQAPLADHDPERDADQVGVLELDARALLAVVDQDVEPAASNCVSRASAASITAGFWVWSGTSRTS